MLITNEIYSYNNFVSKKNIKINGCQMITKVKEKKKIFHYWKNKK
jgi:hypothetical protein